MRQGWNSPTPTRRLGRKVRTIVGLRERQAKICAKWSDPHGGRDCHVCRLAKGHAGHDHKCKCGAEWSA